LPKGELCELKGGGLWEIDGFGDEELCEIVEELCVGGGALLLRSSATLTAEQAIPKTTRLNPSRYSLATIPSSAAGQRVVVDS
jgi:hypothetical protein